MGHCLRRPRKGAAPQRLRLRKLGQRYTPPWSVGPLLRAFSLYNRTRNILLFCFLSREEIKQWRKLATSYKDGGPVGMPPQIPTATALTLRDTPALTPSCPLHLWLYSSPSAYYYCWVISSQVTLHLRAVLSYLHSQYKRIICRFLLRI